jgi:hypothetical protein
MIEARGASPDLPPPFVDVELHQAFIPHFQQQLLAGFLIGDIGALHDFVNLQRLLAKRAQDIFAIIQQAGLLPSSVAPDH